MNRFLTTVVFFSKRALVMAFFSKRGTCQNVGAISTPPPSLPQRSRRPCSKRKTNTIRIWSTPIFQYFDLYLYSVYAAHYVYLNVIGWTIGRKLKGKFRLSSNSSHDDFELEFSKAAFRASEKKEITFSVTSTVAMRR